jgi:GT2 family glycosyltransferase
MAGELPRFSPASEYADVTVLIVTFNNESDVSQLLTSLRHEAEDQSIKVIVADNSPSSATLGVLSIESDVLSFPTGGNFGYAGGINRAMERVGATGSVLVLNPDLWVQRGAVKALRDRMTSSGAGVVVPKLVDGQGALHWSLRKEPGLVRSLGDALLGGRFQGRPGWLSETVFDPRSYTHPHTVDWATGAALLIRPDVAALVGSWDERFFLYSEETDFFRRVRCLGAEVWFEPSARIRHKEGGSGTSPDLTALLAINRIRYARKHGGRTYSSFVRIIVGLAEFARSWQPGHRRAFRAVLDGRSWDTLPHATRYPGPVVGSQFPPATVVVPAHNEEAVIRRTLARFTQPLGTGSIEVIVACNGCVDGTEAAASSVPGVQVIRVKEASKVAALNAGDKAATLWPRIYLDADIEISEEALRLTIEELSSPGAPCAARPAFRYDTRGATRAVKAYYRARSRIPGASAGLWGAGMYGLSERGHDILGEFPAVTGDDYYIDGLYAENEKRIVQCDPVLVRTPRSATDLLATLRRVYRGNAEQDGASASSASGTLKGLLVSVRGPMSAADGLVYIFFALAGRWESRAVPAVKWERDESSRTN